MFYVVTTESGIKALVSSRCQKSAKHFAEQRLDTRVVDIDYLEAVIHSDFSNLAILSKAEAGDSS